MGHLPKEAVESPPWRASKATQRWSQHPTLGVPAGAAVGPDDTQMQGSQLTL